MADTEKKTEDAPEDPTKTAAYRELMGKVRRKNQTAGARPLLTVYGMDGKPSGRRIKLPDVMLTPIRHDLVSFVHQQISKNSRQPYAVMNGKHRPHGDVAGHQVAAKSWGTGRAVSRVPRVKGGGTHRAGQGAYGNMCRGGHIFAPTKIWRRWHRHVNQNQRRFAVCSALAASAVPALVMARGHRVDRVPEIPLVMENDFQKPQKTKIVMNTFRALKLGNELRRCKKRYMRAGRGKMRNRRWKHRTGPLIVFAKDNGIEKASRNIRGVDCCSVYHLNLLKLCPGGHLGRMIIWTEAAIDSLQNVWGTHFKRSLFKKNYRMPRPIMQNSDLRRIIMSQEIQSVLRPTKRNQMVRKKRNPLKDPELMSRLNPDFAEEWKQIKESGRFAKRTKRPTTEVIMKQIAKKRKLNSKPFQGINLKLSDKKKYSEYWQNVFGDDKIFKSAALLKAEKKAVAEAMEAQEREKAGLDLMEILKAEQAAADASDSDS